MTNQITVAVAGETNTGKSRVARIILAALANAGVGQLSLNDAEPLPQGQTPEQDTQILKRLAPSMRISVKVVQLKRGETL